MSFWEEGLVKYVSFQVWEEEGLVNGRHERREKQLIRVKRLFLLCLPKLAPTLFEHQNPDIVHRSSFQLVTGFYEKASFNLETCNDFIEF